MSRQSVARTSGGSGTVVHLSRTEEWARLRFARAIATSRRVARAVAQIQAAEPRFGREPLAWSDAMAVLRDRFALRVERRRGHTDGLVLETGVVVIDERVEESCWGVFVAVHELAHWLMHFKRRVTTPLDKAREEAEANTVALLALQPVLRPPFPAVVATQEERRWESGGRVALVVRGRGGARRIIFERTWNVGAGSSVDAPAIAATG